MKVDTADVSRAFSSAPQWATVLLVVVSFCIYMDRHEERMSQKETKYDAVSAMRIAQCHKIQEESIAIMSRVITRLEANSSVMERLISELENLPKFTE
jgi:hypothetical protein